MSWRRLANWLVMSIVLVFAVSALTFLLISLTPGDAARTVVGPEASAERYQEVRAQLGLDLPVWQQYLNWLGGLLTGDPGRSLLSGVPIDQVLQDRIEPTLALMLCAFVCSTIVGITLGVVSASRGGALGRFVDMLSLGGIAVPTFWIGLVLVAVFSVGLGWLPTSGYRPIADGVGEWLPRMILPIITLTLAGTALLARQTRDAVAEQLTMPYIVLLRAHGVSERSLVWRHALRNAAVPIITILGMKLIGLTTGTVLVETVFSIPGLGSYAVQQTQAHDLPVVQIITLIFTIVVVVTNLLVELGYGRLNVKARA
ncbi:ABC transporter permease [Agromyces archimandritae]|uniref:ABC transporter permease n=1 Tax=Agromyces archimandritae TaxID=2781962 RepID=A0A975FNW0_9MICO|nr:ABC transporter permease [Agromyces archimandritae]QTX05635.1 ABC transporter permease [Agromyces archimandritae]